MAEELSHKELPHKGQKHSFPNCKKLADFIFDNDVEIIDCCFVDPIGVWQHCSFSPSYCSAEDLEQGFAFDGSSIKLFTSVHNSDMFMKPDPTSCWIDPFWKRRTLHVNCTVSDSAQRPFKRCPRYIAKLTQDYVSSLGFADQVFFGPEPEFFVFDDVRYSVTANRSMFEVDTREARWRAGCDGSMPASGQNVQVNLGHTNGPKGYYFPVAPQDQHMDLRSEMLLTLRDIGIKVEKHHHEVATAQHELGFACGDMVTTADNVMAYKYIVKNVAQRFGKSATFMPKPLFGDNGTGMHCHMSIWKNGKNLFYDENGTYAKLSQIALYYIGGLLKHAPAVLAFSNPTVNSYKRLLPGFEAPATLVFSEGNRSAAIRIPRAGDNPKAKRIEFRCPDPSCCPHLAFAAMTLAGIDGILNKIEPPPAVDFDLYELTAEQKKNIPSTPASLEEALDALESDNEFLLAGGAFTKDFIDAHIALKRAEAKSAFTQISPKEFEMYYNC